MVAWASRLMPVGLSRHRRWTAWRVRGRGVGVAKRHLLGLMAHELLHGAQVDREGARVRSVAGEYGRSISALCDDLT
jgi:hypothetical protein